MSVSLHNIQYTAHRRLASRQQDVGAGGEKASTLPYPSFWAKVQKTDTCWLWTGFIERDGYGQLTVDGAPTGAHRISWRLHHGAIPPGLMVCHTCDVRHCVNPAHLFLGTARDNAHDAIRKGRFFAVRPTRRRLTEVQAEEIRAAYRRGLRMGEGMAFARRFGISSSFVSRIGYGRKYRLVSATPSNAAAVGLDTQDR